MRELFEGSGEGGGSWLSICFGGFRRQRGVRGGQVVGRQVRGDGRQTLGEKVKKILVDREKRTNIQIKGIPQGRTVASEQILSKNYNLRKFS